MTTLNEFIPFATTPSKCSDLSDCLTVYAHNVALVSNDKQVIDEITEHCCQSQASQGIYYTEVRLTPVK